MATPRRIRNLRRKIEELEEQISDGETPKLRRMLKTAQKDLALAEKMEEIRLRQEKELEAYRIKQELKTINKIAVIEREEQKIRKIIEGYSETRSAKKIEKIEEAKERQLEEDFQSLAKTDPRKYTIMYMMRHYNVTEEEAIEQIKKGEEEQARITEEERTKLIDALAALSEQDKIEEFKPEEIKSTVIDDGLDFLDSAIKKAPEKSFAEFLKEEKEKAS